MKKTGIIIIISAIVVALGAYAFISISKSDKDTSDSQTSPSPTIALSQSSPSATLEASASLLPSQSPSVSSSADPSSSPKPSFAPTPNITTIENDVNKPAVDFSLYGLDGKVFSLSDLKGKPVYLNFFASWSKPSKGEISDIQKISDEYKNKGLEIVIVDLGEEEAAVKEFMQKNNYNLRVLLDPDQNTGNKYSIRHIPSSFFIDKNGNIITSSSGSLDYSVIKENVEKILK